MVNINPAKINKDVTSSYGALLGKHLIRIGKENFDLEYNAKRKDGGYPFLPITAVPKFFLRKVFVECIEFMPDPITGNPMIVFNKDSELTVSATKKMEKSDPALISKLLTSGTPEDLDTIFFEDEETAAKVVHDFNKTTCREIEDAINYLMTAQKGLTEINKLTLAGVEK